VAASVDGAVVAAEIKQLKPQVPIVMLADKRELPDCAWKAVDAIVAKADAPRFLLQTIESVLCLKPAQARDENAVARSSTLSDGPSFELAMDDVVRKEAPFPATVWRSIRKGSVRF
jgi:hypothetical protein